MYRGLLNNARRRRIYKENSLYFDSIKVEKNKRKPINFNNGDHLGDQIHFLLINIQAKLFLVSYILSNLDNLY